ncbi:hypothetical protein IPM62_05595 [Candidatus Woesebacteria bacterium]|nr:MAG: hypothetical protein IPM62_05595 [Candidatus Woesebacteria bacterium]
MEAQEFNKTIKSISNSSIKELYLLMDKNKLTSDKKIYDYFVNTSFEKVLEITTEAYIITTTTNNYINPSLFNFSASISLSGGDKSCGAWECRINKVQEIAAFSSLYADTLTLHNPFDFVYFYINPVNNFRIAERKFRNESIVAFSIALNFKYLIERKLMLFSKTTNLMCSECVTKKDQYLLSIENKLKDIAKNKLYPIINNFDIKYGDNFYNLEGIKDILGEEIFNHFEVFPKYLIKDGIKVNNTRQLKYDNYLIQNLIGNAINSLLFQKFGNINAVSQTYLTTNLFESRLLENLGSTSENNTLNLLAHGLPVLQSKSLEDIIKIREKHKDEFISFREHLYDILEKASFFKTQVEYNAFVNNKLYSELKDLIQIQNEAKKKFIRKGFITGVFLSAIAIPTAIDPSTKDIISTLLTIYNCKEFYNSVTEKEKQITELPIYFYFRLTESLSE